MDAPMTPDQWRALTPSQRRTAWQRWSTAERSAMYEQFAATTPDFSLPYPNDYNDPADSPTAFRELAVATEAALNLMVPDATAETRYVKGPIATEITDWNAALESGFYAAPSGATNSPGTTFETWWMGIVVHMTPVFIHQIAWPAYGYSPYTMMDRAFNNGVWNGWSRVTNYAQSWDDMDNLQTLQHTRAAGHPAVARFAHGMKKDSASVSPTAIDEWRVQCYDTEGTFTWSAIKIPESGIVSMPRGHAVAQSRLRRGVEVGADTAATLGNVVDIVRIMLGGIDPVLTEPADDGSAE